MVNKAALGVALFVLVLMVGVAALLGMQLGGPADGGTPTAATDGNGGNGGSDATTEATPSTSTPSDATTTTTEAPAQTRTPIPASSFNETRIAVLAAEYVNEERRSRGLSTLETEGRTVETVRTMATNHSDAMARTGRITHTLENLSMVQRYKAFGLYRTCQWEAADSKAVLRPKNNNFEALGRVTAGRNVTLNGESRRLSTDREVARALADFWFDRPSYRNALIWPNAGRVGVGVSITDSGEVYGTANLC